MKVMGFAHQANRSRIRIEHGSQNIVIFCTDPRPLGHAKSGKGRTRFRWVFEKRAVGGVGARPATFDVIDAKRVKCVGNLVLFVSRKLDALSLLPIPKGRIKKVQAFFHDKGPKVIQGGHASAIRQKCAPKAVAVGASRSAHRLWLLTIRFSTRVIPDSQVSLDQSPLRAGVPPPLCSCVPQHLRQSGQPSTDPRGQNPCFALL